MNVLSDFIDRVKAQFPMSIEDEELNELLKTISNQEKEIEKLEKEVGKLKKKKS
jgi:alpha-amylase